VTFALLPGTSGNGAAFEDVELSGHIIDSLILPKVLDCITANGAAFTIKDFSIGQSAADPSHALIEIRAADLATLNRVLAQVADHGAVPTAGGDCRLQTADIEGTFPEGFYSTTNQRTEIRWQDAWIAVAGQEMDCGIRVSPQTGSARCVPMNEVRVGDEIVVGHAGVRVFPEERSRRASAFEFMASNVSTEKPKGAAVRQIARELIDNRRAGGQTLLVAGPAIVHTGSGEHLCRLIRAGYVDVLFAGNALAAHDVEQALFGTSLGVYLDRGCPAEAGHEHHLRAINRVRRAGGIRAAVEQGMLRSGIMFECIRQRVPFLLAGSIRDDGPLPEVVTDVLEAQRRMRQMIGTVRYCLMIATTLHSVAVGNLLPSWVRVVCVDINPSTAIKLADRGTFQTVGLVTDVEPFLRVLAEEVEAMK
jgi:lysine-ketoglutarate reductase/saccharopine dehydrogenase-like protein (TIGR00300 family)